MLQINTFSVVDLLAAVLLAGVSIALLYRYLRVTKRSEDGLLVVMLFFLLSYCLGSLVADNIVPFGTPALEVPGAAAHTLDVYRLLYVAATFILTSILHFGLRYCESKHLPGAQALWLYAGGLLICPLYWSESFMRAPDQARSFTSGWLCAVPWQPDFGVLFSIFLALWVAVNVYVQYLFWGRSHVGTRSKSGNLGFNIVRAGITLWGFGGILGTGTAALGYAGVDTTPPITAVSVLLLAIGLGEEYTQSEKERVYMARRFTSYLDPALVKHVLEHQEQPRFEGEVREMSVVFTDLEGYTATFEKLREGAVSLLNEYLGHMSRLIHEHNGYRHQFFGDGTMFFYGAPEHDPHHAIHAVETVLEMQEMIATLNESLATRRRQLCDDVTLAMRVGVSTGQMIVGDSGSEEASDYTVLGDAVNLGARLESANKVFGTRILITERTVELIPADRFLIRPIGKLRVVGLSRAVMTYEPLADATKASDMHRKTAQLTRVMFECFRGADFDGCMSAVEHMDRELGASRLSEVYRQLCDECLRKPPGPGFTGEIVLPTK